MLPKTPGWPTFGAMEGRRPRPRPLDTDCQKHKLFETGSGRLRPGWGPGLRRYGASKSFRCSLSAATRCMTRSFSSCSGGWAVLPSPTTWTLLSLFAESSLVSSALKFYFQAPILVPCSILCEERFRELFRLTGLLPESVFHLQLEPLPKLQALLEPLHPGPGLPALASPWIRGLGDIRGEALELRRVPGLVRWGLPGEATQRLEPRNLA